MKSMLLHNQGVDTFTGGTTMVSKPIGTLAQVKALAPKHTVFTLQALAVK